MCEAQEVAADLPLGVDDEQVGTGCIDESRENPLERVTVDRGADGHEGGQVEDGLLVTAGRRLPIAVLSLLDLHPG